MFERPLYAGNLWARGQSGRVSCSGFYKDSLLAPDRDEAALTGRLGSKSQVAKLSRENGFHSRRKTILAAGPALGSTGRLTRHSESIQFPSLSRSPCGAATVRSLLGR